MFKVYDLKNKKKLVVTGTEKECAKELGCHISYISKAASKDLKIFNQYKVVKK